jgi:hypothetical protein
MKILFTMAILLFSGATMAVEFVGYSFTPSNSYDDGSIAIAAQHTMYCVPEQGINAVKEITTTSAFILDPIKFTDGVYTCSFSATDIMGEEGPQTDEVYKMRVLSGVFSTLRINPPSNIQLITALPPAAHNTETE